MRLESQDSKATQAIISDKFPHFHRLMLVWLATRIILLYLKRILLWNTY